MKTDELKDGMGRGKGRKIEGKKQTTIHVYALEDVSLDNVYESMT